MSSKRRIRIVASAVKEEFGKIINDRSQTRELEYEQFCLLCDMYKLSLKSAILFPEDERPKPTLVDQGIELCTIDGGYRIIVFQSHDHYQDGARAVKSVLEILEADTVDEVFALLEANHPEVSKLYFGGQFHELTNGTTRQAAELKFL